MSQFILDIFLFFIYLVLFRYLVAITWRFWMMYINGQYSNSLDWRLLEIKLPREIDKSPEAAELFLRSIIQIGGLGSWWKVFWLGNIPHVFSLEIASLEGVIHFYIRTQKKFKESIEAAIYSQYPNVEITEVADYTKLIDYDHKQDGPSGVGLWGCEWTLANKVDDKIPDSRFPNKEDTKLEQVEYSGDMYPIKTYKDWALDKNEKEIYKHDPLTYLLEAMASIGKGEYYWHQIIVRAASTNKNDWDKVYEIEGGKDAGKEKTLNDLVKIERERLTKKFSAKKKGDKVGRNDDGSWKTEMIEGDKDKDGKPEMKKEVLLIKEDFVKAEEIKSSEMPEEVKEKLKAINRKINKPIIFAKMRTVYLAQPGKFNGGMVSVHMTPMISSFNEPGFNSFRPDTVADPYDFPWENVMQRRIPWRKQELNDAYKGRDGMFSHGSKLLESTNLFFDIYFWKFSSDTRGIFEAILGIIFNPFSMNYPKKNMCLNLEELATLYHFPGEVAATPGLPRIDSVKGSAPANLPK